MPFNDLGYLVDWELMRDRDAEERAAASEELRQTFDPQRGFYDDLDALERIATIE
jgi:hypothetical protein